MLKCYKEIANLKSKISSKEKEIKLFFEDRANIKHFFEAESWQGSPEGTTILKIEDRTSSYAIQLHEESNFKHPFGNE